VTGSGDDFGKLVAELKANLRQLGQDLAEDAGEGLDQNDRFVLLRIRQTVGETLEGLSEPLERKRKRRKPPEPFWP
jgi:hypothetical protein